MNRRAQDNTFWVDKVYSEAQPLFDTACDTAQPALYIHDLSRIRGYDEDLLRDLPPSMGVTYCTRRWSDTSTSRSLEFTLSEVTFRQIIAG